MQIARRVADSYARHPAIRSRVADVLPVAGLLAFTGATLTESEFASLHRLASMDQVRIEALTTSADRFVAQSLRVQVAESTREELLDRLGLFGVRLAVRLIGSGQCSSAGELATMLEEQSGIRPLRKTLLDRFAGRAEILKAARAIDWVAARATDVNAGKALRREVERVVASSFELAELQALGTVLAMEAGSGFPDDLTRQVVLAALGNDGGAAWQRLGSPEETVPEQWPALLRRRIDELRSASMSPLTSRKAAEMIGVAIRSLEALYGEVAVGDDPGTGSGVMQ
jgi:phage terminase Nu1 subunit (DNA packaging protein)